MKLTIFVLLLTMVYTCTFGKDTRIQATPSAVFCGEEGGYPKYSFKFDISTRKQAAAALSYAWWAPNPDGIRKCVCRYYPDFPSCIAAAEKLKQKQKKE